MKVSGLTDVSCLSGRGRQAVTPTRRRNPFCAADDELSAITLGCAPHDGGLVDRRGASPHRASHCTPLRSIPSTASSPVAYRKSRENTSPITLSGRAAGAPVSPRRRRCTGASAADMDLVCGSPRLHLALPSSTRRLTREQPQQLCDRSGSWAMQDSAMLESHATKASLSLDEPRSRSGTQAGGTPSLSITPTDNSEVSTTSVPYPLLRLVADPRLVDGTPSSPQRNDRPPSSPSFSFFAAMSEKRTARSQAIFDSTTESNGGTGLGSPHSFGLQSLYSPYHEPNTASLSQSTVSVEVKVFSPLRFDARTAPSAPSQGLNLLCPPQRPFEPHAPAVVRQRSQPPAFLDSHTQRWEEASDENQRNGVAMLEVTPVRDVVKQQRLLHACVLSMAKEKAALVREVRQLRERRVVSLLRRLLHLLVRLPLRILAQCLCILARKAQLVVRRA